MKRWLESLFDIRKGEVGRSLIMFLYGFFLLSAYLILKPVRNSLFLTKFGPEQLVFMYMIIAVVAGAVASAYGWFARRISLPRLIGGSILFIIVNLGAFWWLMQRDTFGLVYVFYIWVSLFGVITVSQFWLLANHLFDAREAKRLFPFIGAGSIAGGLAGSKVTNVFAKLVGTESLLFICMGLMALCFVMLMIVWPMRREHPPARKSRDRTEMGGIWSLLSSSRHLQLLAGIIALTVMVSTFIDFQFNTVIAGTFQNKDELTAFLGDFFFWLSVASLALQFLLSSRILRLFGVGAAVLILPFSLLLGSAAIFIWPTLLSAVGLKMADGGLRYSINKAAGELLYLPIPTAIKDRVKALMDVVGDRFARGVGGAMLFVVQYIFHWTVGYVALLSGGLIVGWVWLAVLMRREYSKSFRSALELRTLDSDEVRVQLRDAGSIDALRKSLAEADGRQLRFLLGLTAHTPDPRLREPLWALLDHEDVTIRREALSQFAHIGERDDAVAMTEYVADPDGGIRIAALRFLTRWDPARAKREIRRLLEQDDPRLHVSALECIFAEDLRDLLPQGDASAQIESLLSGDTPTAAMVELAIAFRHLKRDATETRHLTTLLNHSHVKVTLAAIRSAAVVQRRDWVPDLITHLSSHRLRPTASDTLAAYGPRILGTLRDYLIDTQISVEVQRNVPRVISRIGGAEAVAILESHLDSADIWLRHQLVKALNRIHRADPATRFVESIARAELEREARACYFLSAVHVAVADQPDTPSSRLLRKALDDRRRLHMELAFRFAGLVWQPSDMLYAYTAVTQGERAAIASAVEFLDTLWDRRTKDVLFPLLEVGAHERVLIHGQKLFDIRVSTTVDAVREIIGYNDPWLSACAIHWITGEQRAGEVRDAIVPLSGRGPLALREAVDTALTGTKEAGA